MNVTPRELSNVIISFGFLKLSVDGDKKLEKLDIHSIANERHLLRNTDTAGNRIITRIHIG